jgi:hypothetical protein
VFVKRLREVDGFDLRNIPRTTPRHAESLPSYVPFIYHPNRRMGVLDVPVVALPLHRFYSRVDGRPRFANRAQIENAFRIAPHTRILLIGCGRDKPIEAWWALSAQRRVIIETLCDLGITAVTSPNYSLFTDKPRYDDMYNMKRIGNAWHEILAEGMPCALHLNARTRYDYWRLAQFIDDRDDVTEVAFEFGTGAAWPQRRPFHIQHLAKLARYVRQPLRMIMIGGTYAIPSLVTAFANLTYVDTSAFMNTIHRQQLYLGNDGKTKKSPQPTNPGEPVDSLLVKNIQFMRTHIATLIRESQMMAEPGGSAPKQENPETAPSETAVPSSVPAEDR